MISSVCDDRYQGTKRAVRPQSLVELLSLSQADVARCDIPRMNLLCAEGLPGAEASDVEQCLTTLAQWTDSVRRYTTGALPRFRRDPLSDGGDGHEGVFRFVAMVTVLKHPRGLGIAYQPTAKGNFIFLDSRDDLIHGLLTRRLGTCASLPALFVAIGRRLGYPMHLALTKQHFICQWVDADGNRRNLEGSGAGGGDAHPDEFYINGGLHKPLTKDDLATGRYLRPLTTAEQLAAFLEVRGHCLTDNRRLDEATEVYTRAHAIAPHFVRLDGHMRMIAHRRHPVVARPFPRLFPAVPGLPGPRRHGDVRSQLPKPGSPIGADRRGGQRPSEQRSISFILFNTDDLHYP